MPLRHIFVILACFILLTSTAISQPESLTMEFSSFTRLHYQQAYDLAIVEYEDSDGYVFMGCEDPGLLILDYNTWRQPIIGEYDFEATDAFVQVEAEPLAQEGDARIFVHVQGDGVYAFDFDGTTLEQVGYTDAIPNVNDMTLVDDILYLAVPDSGVVVYDVADPASMEWQATWDIESGEVIALAIFSSAASVLSLDGTTVTLTLLGISDPTDPSVWGVAGTDVANNSGIGSVDMNSAAIFIGYDNYVFSYTYGNGTAPSFADDLNLALVSTIYQLREMNDYVYVASGDGGMRVVIANNPTNITQVANFNPLSGANFVCLDTKENYVFLADDFDGFFNVYVTMPNRPSGFARSRPFGIASNVWIDGDVTIMKDDFGGVRFFNIEDIAAPVDLSIYACESIADIAMRDDQTLYFLDSESGLKHMDYSDPEFPDVENEFACEAGEILALDAYNAYICTSEEQMIVLDMIDPDTVIVATEIATEGIANKASVHNGLLYMSTHDSEQENGSIKIWDIEEPYYPFVIQDIAITDGYFMDYEVETSMLLTLQKYTEHSYWTLKRFNVNNPLEPFLVDSLVFDEGTSVPYNMELVDDIVFIAAGDSGIYAVNLVNDSLMQAAGHILTKDCAYGLAVYDNEIVVADDRYLTTFTYTIDNGVVEFDSEKLPSVFTIESAWPNPFNPVVQLGFTLPAANTVNVTVFDLLGREVYHEALGQLSTGMHTFSWDAASFASGPYFISLTTPTGQTAAQRVMLLK